MPECSLCGNPMSAEGGTVLFADGRGVPFIVCGTCEDAINKYRQASSEPEAAEALASITGVADDLGRRDVRDSLVEFLERNRPGAAAQEDLSSAEELPGTDESLGEDASMDAAESTAPDASVGQSNAGHGSGGFLKSAILAAIVFTLVLLALLLGGFRF